MRTTLDGKIIRLTTCYFYSPTTGLNYTCITTEGQEKVPGIPIKDPSGPPALGLRTEFISVFMSYTHKKNRQVRKVSGIAGATIIKPIFFN